MAEYCHEELSQLESRTHQRLGLPSMLNHINAIVDLYHIQISRLTPEQPIPQHPRTASVKQFLATRQ
jgi:hypothetical protein